jgi:Helix-turn-helix of DDE superfamily endonuclease
MMLDNPRPIAVTERDPEREREFPIPYLRCERVRASPAALRALTGLSPDEFDALLRDLEPRHRAQRQARLARPDRRRALGGGGPYLLSLEDRVLLALTWVRHRTWTGRLACLFGVCNVTALRVRKAMLPLLASLGHPQVPPRSLEDREELLALFARDLPEMHPLLAMYLGLDRPAVEYDSLTRPTGPRGGEGLPAA